MKWLLILVVYNAGSPVSFQPMPSKASCEAAGAAAVALLERRTPYLGSRFTCVEAVE